MVLYVTKEGLASALRTTELLGPLGVASGSASVVQDPGHSFKIHMEVVKWPTDGSRIFKATVSSLAGASDGTLLLAGHFDPQHAEKFSTTPCANRD
jgi:hypothetical protein